MLHRRCSARRLFEVHTAGRRNRGRANFSVRQIGEVAVGEPLTNDSYLAALRWALALVLAPLLVSPGIASAQRPHRIEIEDGTGLSATTSANVIALASAALDARAGIAVEPGDGGTLSRVTWHVDANDEAAGIRVRLTTHVLTRAPGSDRAVDTEFSMELRFGQRHFLIQVESEVSRMLTYCVVASLPRGL